MHAALHPSNKISPIIDADWIAAAADRVLRRWRSTHLADLACTGGSTTPNPRRQPHHRQTRSAGRPARRRSAHTRSMPLTSSDDGTRTGGAAAVRWIIGLYRRRCGAVHLGPESSTLSAGWSPPRAAPMDAPSMRSRSTWRCWSRQPTAQPWMPGRPLLSDPWPPQVPGCSWRSPQPAPENDCTTRPHTGLAGGRRPSARTSSVRRSGCSAPRSHRVQRHTRQTHLDLQYLNSEPPEWIYSIGPSTLVLIDEAGMADTPPRRRPVHCWLRRQCSLIGDDQQLPPSVRRCPPRHRKQPRRGSADRTPPIPRPAEGGRIAGVTGRQAGALASTSTGNESTSATCALTENLFEAWRADRSRGLDSIMLAPTRDLVAELNQRACATAWRLHRHLDQR